MEACCIRYSFFSLVKLYIPVKLPNFTDFIYLAANLKL